MRGKLHFIALPLVLITVTVLLGNPLMSENATARVNCETEGTETTCLGGEAYEDRLGGHGGSFKVDTSPGGEFTSSAGFGSGKR